MCLYGALNETSSLLGGWLCADHHYNDFKVRMKEDEERSREHRSTYFSFLLLLTIIMFFTPPRSPRL